MKTKKLLITLFAAVMALAAAAFEVGDLAFETCTVNGTTMVKCTGLSEAGKTKNTNGTIGYIQIPSTVSNGSNRYRVYYIGSSAFAGTKITGVRINWGVYEIGTSAFKGCTQLAEARIASSVQVMQAEGFAGCTALKTVYWAGFGWGTGRMALFWPSNSNMTLYINYEQTHTTSEFKSDWFWQVFKNVYYDNYYCSDVNFSGGYSLTIGESDMQGANTYRNATVTYFDPSKTTINGDTYGASTSDERMGVYYKWTKIGRYALASNSTVKTIDLTNATNLTTINPNAFTGSTELTKVTLPSSLSYYYFNAFYECPKLTEFSVNSANTTFSSYDGCIYNKSQTLFYQAPQGKTSVSFSSSVKTINDWAFYNCAKITKIFVPYGVTTIGANAFSGTTSLDYTFIPSSVTSLSTDRVFYGTKYNNYIYCNMQNPPTVNAANYFGTHSGMRLYVPYGRESAYTNAGWTGFYAINSDNIQAIDISYNGTGYTVTSTASTTVNGTSYNGRVKVVCYGNPSMSDPTSIEIPASITHNGKTYAVTMIGEDAFNNHTTNFTVTGCVNIDTIGAYAFEGQPVTKYAFNHHIKRIDAYAFNRAGLTGTVHVPFGTGYIGSYAFANGKYSRLVIAGYPGIVGNFCYNTTTLTELVMNQASSSYYNFTGWDLGTVPNNCYIRVPMGVVGQWKNNSKLKSRASYITGGAYDFVAGTGYTGRYFMTITSSSQTTFDGTTYAGTAKYVYSPHTKASTNTSDYQWEKSETDGTVSTDERRYLMTEIGDSAFVDVNNFGFSQYQMPASIKKIGNSAFYYATKMTNANLKLPDGLNTIGKYAFYGTKLSGEIKIPEAVTYIGDYAFAYMTNLNALYFPKSKPSTLGKGAWGTNNASNFTVWVPNHYAYGYLSAAQGWGSADYANKLAVWIKPTQNTMMFSSVIPANLQSSDINAYYASNFDKNNTKAQVTLTKANQAPENTGLLLVDLNKNQEYRIKRPTSSVSAPMTNYFIAASLNNSNNVDVYNQTVGFYWNASASIPHFVRPTSSYSIDPSSAYLKLSSSEAGSLKDVYTSLYPNSGILGDLDNSGIVDVEDVNAAINIFLRLATMSDYPGNGDMNGDGKIDVEDINAMINITLHL